MTPSEPLAAADPGGHRHPPGTTVPAPVRADRAAGVVLASAVGDALGAGYEFGPPLGSEVAVDMVGGGVFGWNPASGPTTPRGSSSRCRVWGSG